MKKFHKKFILPTLILFFFSSLYFLYTFLGNIFYDLNFKFSSSKSYNSAVIIGIDSKSIEVLGPLPWPRSELANLIEKINSNDPKVIALDFLFPKRDDEIGNDSLVTVFKDIENLLIGLRLDDVSDKHESSTALVAPEAYNHRFFKLKNKNELINRIIYSASQLNFGDPFISVHADWGGFLNVSISRTSQKLREIIHVIRVGNEYYPSFGLSAAAAYLGVKKNNFVLDGNGAVLIDTLNVNLSSFAGTVRLNFQGNPGTIKTIPAIDIINGKFDTKDLRDKLVFIGITDPLSSPANFFATPAGSQFPGVEIWATSALDIIHNSCIKDSTIITIINFCILIFLFPGCVLFFPSSKKIMVFILSTSIFILSIITGFVLFKSSGQYWNSGVHFYSWIMIIVYYIMVKSDKAI